MRYWAITPAHDTARGIMDTLKGHEPVLVSNTTTGHAITKNTYRSYEMFKCKHLHLNKYSEGDEAQKSNQGFVTFTTLALLCSRRDRLVSDLRTPSLVTCSEKSAPTPDSGQAAVSRVGGWFCRKTK